MQKIFYIENGNFIEVNDALRKGATVAMIQAVPQIISTYGYAGGESYSSNQGEERGSIFAYVVLNMPE